MGRLVRKWLPCLALALASCSEGPTAMDTPDMADLGPLATSLV